MLITTAIVSLFVSIKECFQALFSNFSPCFFRRKDITNQNILITGAGNGLGQLMAIEFAKLKTILVLWDVDQNGLQETKRQCEEQGATVFCFVIDISSRENVYKAAENVYKTVEKINILINNAGIIRNVGSFLEKDDRDMEKTIQVNFLAHFWMAKAFLPDMLKRDSGHIVTICSMSGLIGAYGIVDYSASKFGAVGFQEALENEVWSDGHKGLKFTTVCPTYIATRMLDDIPTVSRSTVLNPNVVVSNIVHAVLTEKRILLLPKSAYFLYAAKGLLPRVTFQRLLLWRMRKYG